MILNSRHHIKQYSLSQHHLLIRKYLLGRVHPSSNMYVSGKMNEKQAEHRCDLNLTEVTAPIKAV